MCRKYSVNALYLDEEISVGDLTSGLSSTFLLQVLLSCMLKKTATQMGLTHPPSHFLTYSPLGTNPLHARGFPLSSELGPLQTSCFSAEVSYSLALLPWLV